ncbi:MAG TPA: cysteine desulfurase [Polyangia bacterium]|jgi:cysteine desulfurase/selenocysteine lyase
MQTSIDPAVVRPHFPVLERVVGGRPLVYFDNAASALKPRPVIDAVSTYLACCSANIHRGRHLLSEEASELYEASRDKVARFFNAQRSGVIFVRGATEAINVVAAGMRLRPADNVVGTVLEHHSNILPWRCRCEYRGAPLTPAGLPDLAAAEALIDEQTRLVTVTGGSNVTGVAVPVRPWADMAHRHGLPLLVDAAQAASHGRCDVHQYDCDFFAASGHKMCGPTGIGVLIGKETWLERLDPIPLGGGSVSLVRPDFSYELRDLPWRLEAGTPNIAGAIGLGAAVDYLEAIGVERIERRNRELRRCLDEQVAGIPGLVTLRPAPGADRTCIVAVADAAQRLAPDYFSRVLSDSFGIMVRGGHHCAHPLHAHFGLPGSLRLSLQFYNTEEEIAYVSEALRQTIRMFAGGAAAPPA